MTEELFREDSYIRECSASVVSAAEGGIVLDRTIFYPLGGGQPGDTGKLSWNGGSALIVDTRYGENREILHLTGPGASLPAPGETVKATIDWDRRYRHMRMHTALHLLGAVLRYGVTGGNIGVERSRLDFDMEEGVDKADVSRQMQAYVDAGHPVRCRWITDAELQAQPELVRTMSVQPPKGAGRVRLLEIEGVDLQPCGGTHLRSTAEVGRVSVAKVEKKGRRNRRVYIELD
ncbi:MAG TPA: alanyl-tRNA editing protein [Woeseiaceae bacterium]|nr:alanyl-tRNA editing protein [Woeseiaceae bacterium]